jgi:hypothetical protein
MPIGLLCLISLACFSIEPKLKVSDDIRRKGLKPLDLKDSVVPSQQGENEWQIKLIKENCQK